jgi:predicted HTH domain antitoxin
MKKDNNVLRELRRIRQKHYEETKHMSLNERAEYYHQKSREFRKELAKHIEVKWPTVVES